jgi:hypothetical protein
MYWYYQIKGLVKDKNAPDYESKWSWPPLFSGRIEADSSKEARYLIEGLFDKKFPGKIKKDDYSNSYLLKISKYSSYENALFEEIECKECGRSFRRIDLYNDINESYKGKEYCSSSCRDKHNIENKRNMVAEDDPYGNIAIPCIYRITNKKSGKSYIGQTKQSFTLRWWQHVKWGATNCKFHNALQNTPITDWKFEVIEVCEENELNERETYYIKFYNTVDKGYNSNYGNNNK